MEEGKREGEQKERGMEEGRVNAEDGQRDGVVPDGLLGRASSVRNSHKHSNGIFKQWLGRGISPSAKEGGETHWTADWP